MKMRQSRTFVAAARRPTLRAPRAAHEMGHDEALYQQRHRSGILFGCLKDTAGSTRP